MLRSNPCDLASSETSPVQRFVLYVEGPSDCYILRTWAGLVSRPLAGQLAKNAVILGGRRPVRALEHFGNLRASEEQGSADATRGICVLDRDGYPEEGEDEASGIPDGLDFFTWPRRHIESYLLVPTAMRRSLRMNPGDPRLDELLRDLPRKDAEDVLRGLDAKRLLVAKSARARELGASLTPARIARCMNRGDLHRDVLELIERLRSATSLPASAPGGA